MICLFCGLVSWNKKLYACGELEFRIGWLLRSRPVIKEGPESIKNVIFRKVTARRLAHGNG